MTSPAVPRRPAAFAPRVVLALLRDRGALARVTDALRSAAAAGEPTAVVRSVTTVAAFLAAVAERAYALVVVEAHDADGVSTAEAVRVLRERHPAVPVLGHAVARAGMSTDVMALVRAGVHELVVAGVDDVAATLRAALARTGRRASAEGVLREVAAGVPAGVLPALRYALEHADAAPSVPELARALGVSRQALAARLRAAGLPGPRALLAWCRLLLAAELLAAGGRTVDYVALELDFPSANGFRNVLRRYAGVGPADVRRDGGAAVRAAFRDALRGERVGGPDARRAVPAGGD